MGEMGAMGLDTGGPDTHDDPHETVAARTACETPPFAKKNILETIKSF